MYVADWCTRLALADPWPARSLKLKSIDPTPTTSQSTDMIKRVEQASKEEEEEAAGVDQMELCVYCSDRTVAIDPNDFGAGQRRRRAARTRKRQGIIL